MGAGQDPNLARERADFCKGAAIGASALLDNAAAHIVVQRQGKGFVVLITHRGVFLGVKAQLLGHSLVEGPADFVHNFIALGVWAADLLA